MFTFITVSLSSSCPAPPSLSRQARKIVYKYVVVPKTIIEKVKCVEEDIVQQKVAMNNNRATDEQQSPGDENVDSQEETAKKNTVDVGSGQMDSKSSKKPASSRAHAIAELDSESADLESPPPDSGLESLVRRSIRIKNAKREFKPKSLESKPSTPNPSKTNISKTKSSIPKILKRRISGVFSNDDLVAKIQWYNAKQLSLMTGYSLSLPDLTKCSNEFRSFVETDLIDSSTINALESANVLNWWTNAGFGQMLWPLVTTGDGNCLLHAVSLAMWGFQDRKLTLRSALYAVLSSGECKEALWRRWRFQQTRFNKQAGLMFSEEEWSKEWEEIVAMASPEPKSTDKSSTYKMLEEIHIFALAHLLRRPIFVFADKVLRDVNGEVLAPISFGGIYLPFEIEEYERYRTPLLLTYDSGHFSALVSMEASDEQPPPLIPLTDFERVMLPIQFCIDPGADFEWESCDGGENMRYLYDRVSMLKEYINIVCLSPQGERISEDLQCKVAKLERIFDATPQSTERILCVQLEALQHDHQNEMIQNYLSCAQVRFLRMEKAKQLNSFLNIDENEYQFNRKISEKMKKMTCECQTDTTPDQIGCGDTCLNRQMLIECGPKCAFGDRCTNRRLQKHDYSGCTIFKTEKKGYGLIATAHIPAGQLIMEYVGEVLNLKQYEKRAVAYSRMKNTHEYIMQLSSDCMIDAKKKGNISRFSNHSCDPNAESQKWIVNGETRIGLFSIKDIMPNEEITYDYHLKLNG